jgi:hypothetical protein
MILDGGSIVIIFLMIINATLPQFENKGTPVKTEKKEKQVIFLEKEE